MGQRERGHDFEDVHERGSKGVHAPPAFAFPLQDRRQEQRHQEQDVIVAGPDMVYAFLQKGEEMSSRKTLHRMFWTEHGGIGFSANFEPPPTAMQRVRLEEQSVIDLNLFRIRQAIHGEW